jgi:hypothetical protein
MRYTITFVLLLAGCSGASATPADGQPSPDQHLCDGNADAESVAGCAGAEQSDSQQVSTAAAQTHEDVPAKPETQSATPAFQSKPASAASVTPAPAPPVAPAANPSPPTSPEPPVTPPAPPPPDPLPICTAGQSRTCTLSGGAAGTQACAADGMSYAECQSPPPSPPAEARCACRQISQQEVTCSAPGGSCQGPSRSDQALCDRVAAGERSYWASQATQLEAGYPTLVSISDPFQAPQSLCAGADEPITFTDHYSIDAYAAGGCTCRFETGITCTRSLVTSLSCD